MQFVNEQKYFASTEGSHIEQSLIRSYPSFSVTAVDRTHRQVLRAQRAHRADGHGLRVRREPIRCSRKRASPPRKRSRCTRRSRRRRPEDADPPPVEPVAHDPRVGRPPDRARSRARLRGELRRHQLPHHRQAREVRVRLEARQHRRRQDAGARDGDLRLRRRRREDDALARSSRTACSSTTRRRATRRT